MPQNFMMRSVGVKFASSVQAFRNRMLMNSARPDADRIIVNS